MTPRPPRLAEWLMRLSLPEVDRETALGDLSEEFADRAATHGLAPARAWYRRQVRRSIGSNLSRRSGFRPDDERTRSLRGLGRDVRDAVRSLRATPGFTIVALAVLTLGIGATTAIFSVVNAVALRPLAFPDDGRLVTIRETSALGPGVVDPRDYIDWRAQQDVFEDLAATSSSLPTGFTNRDGDVQESLSVLAVTASFFSTFHTPPALGHAFDAGSEVAGNDHVAVLSDAYWRRRFGANPLVIGQTLALDNGSWIIAGVMPPTFMYPVDSHVDLWVPYVIAPGERIRGNGHDNYLTVIARLKPGVGVARAQSRMTEISNGLAAAYPAWYASNRNRAVVTGLRDTIVGADVRSWMLMLLAAVGFVLLIACANVANLLLARAAARGQELGVRAALGATRWDIARGLLVESLVLSLAGTALGVVVAWWGSSALHAALPPRVPRAAGIGIDLRVLAAAALASIVTGVGFGLAPAVRGSRRDVSTLLRESGRSATASAARQRLRTMLVIAEVSLAVVLLVGAGLFITSFARVVSTSVGIDFHGVTSVAVAPPTAATGKQRAAAANQSMHEMLERVRALPGVTDACVFNGGLPFSGNYHRTSATRADGTTFNGANDGPDIYWVTPAYFSTLQLARVTGRTFAESDDRDTAEPTAVLNAAAAARYFQDSAAVGQVLRVGTGGLSSTNLVVVGVVANMRPLGPDTPTRPEVYVPISLSNVTSGYLLVRAAGDPARLTAPIKSAVAAVAPGMVFREPQSLDGLFATRIAARRFNMVLLALFGALALAIACTGIYGVIAYLVAQRTTEIGVRMALGARPAGIVRMVLVRTSVLVGAGLSVGLVLAWALAGSLRAFLFEISPHDPAVYALVPLALVLAGLAAAFGPARRASKIDPIVALRGE